MPALGLQEVVEETRRWSQWSETVARAQRKSDSARSTGFPVPATDYEKLADVAGELLSELQQSRREVQQLRKEQQGCRHGAADSDDDEDGGGTAGARLKAFSGGSTQLQHKLLQQEEALAQQELQMAQQRVSIRALERALARAQQASPEPAAGSDVLKEARSEAAALAAANSELASELVEAKAAVAGLEQLALRNAHVVDELQRLQQENGLLRDKVKQVKAAHSAAAVASAIERGSVTSNCSSPMPQHSVPSSPMRRATSQPLSPGAGSSAARPAWRSDTAAAVSPRAGAGGASPRKSKLEEVIAELDDGSSEESELAFVGRRARRQEVESAYIMRRTGGGFEPALPAEQGPAALDEAAEAAAMARSKIGVWVPKPAVSLMQEFKRRHAMRVKWSHCEALLLLLDDVYRQRAAQQVAGLRAANSKLSMAASRKVAQSRSYPSVVYSTKLAFLQQQLAAAQEELTRQDGPRRHTLASLAEKGYHLGRQLDWTLEENLALRSDLAAAEEAGGALAGERVSQLLQELGGRVDRAAAKLGKQLGRLAGIMSGAEAQLLQTAASDALGDIRSSVAQCRVQAQAALARHEQAYYSSAGFGSCEAAGGTGSGARQRTHSGL